MKYIIGNLKMNLLEEEVNKYILDMYEFNHNNIIFAPTSIYLKQFVNSNLHVSAQDVSFEENGAYTGDISALQLKSIGVEYSIVGHSERRKYYDDNKYINQKIKMCLKNNIKPILCIGENLLDRQNNNVSNILSDDIDKCFDGLSNNDISKIIVAYEPLWSIGTGIVPSNDEIFETVDFIKKLIYEKYNTNVHVLYGGSINEKNIIEFEKIKNLDGYLIGGSSIDSNKFRKIIKFIDGGK